MKSDFKFQPTPLQKLIPRFVSQGTLVGVCLFAFLLSLDAIENSPHAYGLASRPAAKAYLQMPDRAEGELPPLLSQTGAFKNTSALEVSNGLIPYDLNVSFWSDGALKSRWISVPSHASITFAASGEWAFPPGTIFIKHFDLATDETRPDLKRRLETRLLVRDAAGGVYGVTYKWRADNSDADLLATNLSEAISIQTATGVRTQMWYYPSRQDCITCHTPLNGGVLGVKTRQLNREITFPSGVTDNQLRAWNHIGLFEEKLEEVELKKLPRLARANDFAQSLEDRARSYLDANCAHCHRPNGTVANFDARFDTPLGKQNLIGGPILINEGIDSARVIAPNDIWRSILFMRVNRLDGLRMPPLAHGELDRQGSALMRQWILSLPGPKVLPPPEISPPGGNFSGPVEVSLQAGEPGANIRYTLDGSVPTVSDFLYEKPIPVSSPTVIRAKAFKPGFTKSITAQEVFSVGE